jgi:hypothetical protein
VRALEEGREDDFPGQVSWKGRWFDVPDLETLQQCEWGDDCEALDGCYVEPDGYCPDGYPSWFLALGLI